MKREEFGVKRPKRYRAFRNEFESDLLVRKHELRKKLERGVIASSISVQKNHSAKEDHLPGSRDFVPKMHR